MAGEIGSARVDGSLVEELLPTGRVVGDQGDLGERGEVERGGGVGDLAEGAPGGVEAVEGGGGGVDEGAEVELVVVFEKVPGGLPGGGEGAFGGEAGEEGGAHAVALGALAAEENGVGGHGGWGSEVDLGQRSR